jgi:uncharacterized Tic20 family protein
MSRFLRSVKHNMKEFHRFQLRLAMISFCVIIIGLVVALAGANLPGQIGSILVLAGIIIAIIGAFIGGYDYIF